MIDKSVLKTIPAVCGCYVFWEKEVPLYVGKAIHLRARIAGHLQNARHDRKEAAIIEKADRISVIEYLNEFDALVAEAALISRYQPFYNLRLKDDKSYLYIKITLGEEFPKISATRHEHDAKSLYFGPFESRRVVRFLLSAIRRIIPFCTQKSIGRHRCFYSKIGLCNPCPNLVSHETRPKERNRMKRLYRTNIRRVIAILSGKSHLLIKTFEAHMQSAAKKGDFDNALLYRNRLTLLTRLLNTHSMTNYEPTFVGLVSPLHDDLTAFLKEIHPEQIEKDEPYRIECYDISTLFGKQVTGSMVVFHDGQSVKSEYRRFRIKKALTSDFASLSEVLSRRFSRQGWQYPDLIMIDGGKPQLRAVRTVFERKGITIPICGLAKRPDRLFLAKTLMPIFVPPRSALFKLFQEIRDESHRFAKKYHLLLRSKELM